MVKSKTATTNSEKKVKKGSSKVLTIRKIENSKMQHKKKRKNIKMKINYREKYIKESIHMVPLAFYF